MKWRPALKGFFGGAAIVGYGETPVSSGKKEKGDVQLTAEEYLAWAAELTLDHAGLTKDDVNHQGLAVSSQISRVSALFSAEFAETLGMTPRYLIRSDHGGASALSLLRQSMVAVSSGVVDLVLVLAPGSLYGSALAPYNVGRKQDFEDYAAGMQGPNAHFALVLRRHMHQYGTKLEHLAHIAISQRENALLNDNAYFREPITMDQYRKSRMVADPLRLLDIVMRVNGGLGYVVASREKAKQIVKRSGRTAVYLAGFGERDNYYHGDTMRPDITYMGIRPAATEAFDMAGLAPDKMEFLQLYDDYTIAVLMQLEEMGFCEKGDGGDFVEKTDIRVSGNLPINTGGGQLSAGQVTGVGGFTNLVEGIRQLMHEGGRRQVASARVGCVTGIGGLSFDRNTTNNTVAVLNNEEAQG